MTFMTQRGRSGGRRSFWWVGGPFVVVVVAVVTLVAVLLSHQSGPAAAPAADAGTNPANASVTGDYGDVPQYTLTDQNGAAFSSSALRGKVQVVAYLFPYCTSYCPIIGRTMQQTEQLVDQAGLTGKVEFVAFNVDPAGAGPAQMRAFLSEFGISPTDPAWHFLTGTPTAIQHVVRDGFHVYYKKVSRTEEDKQIAAEKANGTYVPQPDEPNTLATKANVRYDIVHNDMVEVVGPSGRIRNLLTSGSTTTAKALFANIKRASVPA